MATFEMGQKVKVIVEERNGQIGEIIDVMDNEWAYDYEVKFPDGYALCFDAHELAPAQPATADAGERDTLAGVDKVGILEKYLREGRLIDAIKAHRRFYGSDIREAKEACDQLKYDMKLREQNQPTYAELQAKLAAAEARADAAVEAHNNLLTLIRKWTYTSMDGFTAVTDDHGEVAAAALQTSAHGKGA